MSRQRIAITRDAAIALCGAVAVMAASFVFFQCFYQQHLLHREQNTLMVMSAQYIAETYHGIGWLSGLIGDYLTQYFYYLGAGAAIIAVSLTAIWLLVYALVRQFTGCSYKTWTYALSAVLATALTAWEALRETGSSFQFASTIAIVILLAIANLIILLLRRRKSVGIIALVILAPAGVYCFGFWHDKWINVPDFNMEKVMAIDNAAYFGQWNKVRRLSADMTNTRIGAFYNSLANARKGELTEAIKDKIAFGPEILLPIVGPESSYMRIGATGRAWHAIGDYTKAEHCYILALIFSPRSTGSRYLRELAQVNIDNGDHAAAAKYLRMLTETAVHGRWARQQLDTLPDMPLPEGLPVDTVGPANDMTRTLRLISNVRPDNMIAYEYLMNYHLVTGNTRGIMADYDPSRPNHDWYQQALLIAMSQSDTEHSRAAEYGVSPSVMARYARYIDQYLSNEGDLSALKREFGDTYWYQYQLLTQQQ